MENKLKFNEKFSLIRTEKYNEMGFSYLDVYDVYSKPFGIRRGSIDETLCDHILVHECYQPDLWFNRNLREEYKFRNVECVIDIGANIGVASCYFSNLYEKASIYSFEVEESNFELLKQNMKAYPNVRVFNMAIWNDNKGVFINNREKIYGHSGKANPAKFTVAKETIENEKKIDSISISDFIKQRELQKVDILKMDIQGAEIEAFEDGQLWLPYVRLLFVEIHDLFRNGCSKKVFSELAENGKFKFIGSPNGEVLAFLREDEL